MAFELGTEGSLISHDKIISAPPQGPVILSATLTYFVQFQGCSPLPGGAMILGGGCGMVWLIGYSFFEEPWLVWSTVLLGLAGVLWVTVLAPCQRKMLRLAENSLAMGRIGPRLTRFSRIWDLVGSGATMLPLIAGFLMITA